MLREENPVVSQINETTGLGYAMSRLMDKGVRDAVHRKKNYKTKQFMFVHNVSVPKCKSQLSNAFHRVTLRYWYLDVLHPSPWIRCLGK